ncbi:putative sulfur-rich protein, partial [Chlamydia psittaci 03DC29]
MSGENANSIGSDVTSLIQPGLEQVMQDEGVQVS